MASRHDRPVTTASDSSRDAETAGLLAQSKQQDVSRKPVTNNGSSSSSSSMEAIMSKVMENSLRPYMDRLQRFEEKVSSEVARIDDTVRNLQTAVNDLSKNVATVLQSVNKYEVPTIKYSTELSSQGSSVRSSMQSITPRSCMSSHGRSSNHNISNSHIAIDQGGSRDLVPQSEDYFENEHEMRRTFSI